VIFAMQGGQAPSVPKKLREVIDRLGGRAPQLEQKAQLVPAGVAATPAVPAASASDGALVAAAGSPGLEVRDLSVHFGGVRAVSEVSLEAPLGRITGLVGPNGAGKTTIFNACSGLLKPSRGAIFIRDREVTRLGPAGRSRLGLGRTFQKAELFNSLSVRENIVLGRESAMAGANPVTQLVPRPGDRADVKRAVDEAIELTGIGALSDLQAGLLPAGQRRMVELARTLAGDFDLLLLDEPSSGLDGPETRHFGEILTNVVAERGVGILLVEHDMALVRQVCSRIFVLDFGRLVFDGTPAEMLSSETVRAAYLGSEGVEAAADERDRLLVDEAIESA
jgi:ABC-type branched-subunit amino acid transport system ATPase component